MPYAVRQFEPRSLSHEDVEHLLEAAEPAGPVGALNRAIEDRLLIGANAMGVIPLIPRPAEILVEATSRWLGWVTTGSCFILTALTICR